MSAASTPHDAWPGTRRPVPGRGGQGKQLSLSAATLFLVSCAGLSATEPRPLANDSEATPLAVVETLSVFIEASDLAVGPGRVAYVTDVGTNTLTRIDGGSKRVLGGSGTESGQFDEPRSVDPTNGLVILVADAGNGRIQRFSREFRPLGSLGVEASSFDRLDRPLTGSGDDQRPAAEQGRPIAVVTSSSDEIFAIDATARVVLKWDASLRPDQVIGGYGSRYGRLVDPVALATDGQRMLFVLDAELNAVMVYDLFGTPLRTLASGQVAGARSLAVSGERLVITLPHAVYVYSLDGSRLGTLAPGPEVELVDAYPLESSFLLLTSDFLLTAVPTRPD